MPDGKPLPGFQDREIITLDGVRIGLTGATFDDTPRTSSPGDLQFLPTVAHHRRAGRAAARGRRRLRRRGRRMPSASRTTRCSRRARIDLILTGHDHDLFINYDERNAMVESSYDAHYVTAIDVTIAVKEQDGRRVDDLVAAVPRRSTPRR